MDLDIPLAKLKRWLARTRVWRRIRYTLRGHPHPDPGHFQARRFPCGRHAYLETFWKKQPHGKGPAVLACVRGQRLVLFDCFGPDGHWHISYGRYQPRDCMHMMERSVPAQIERAVFELTQNLGYFQGGHPWSEIRKVRLENVEEAALKAGAAMRELLESVPELADLR